MKSALSRNTSLLAAALSASGSAGLFCLILVAFAGGLGPIGAHPLEISFGIAGGIAMLVVSILLLGLYIRERKKRLSIPGIFLDLLLLLLLFYPFFLLWAETEGLLSRIF